MSHRTLDERATAAQRIERERVRRQLRRAMFAGDAAPVRIDRFEIRGRLGAGATGLVYAAYDPQLDREVAVKLLVVAPIDDHAALSEARTLARCAHPNVLPVYEVGTHDGIPFIVSELVGGGSLRAWLAQPHPPAEVRAVVLAIGRGLAEAHHHGIVHRDLKPENVLVGLDGRPRVADFGLARWFDPATHRIEHGIAGTPTYMAPEQAAQGIADPRSDQYAYALVAFEALYGRFPADGPGEVVARAHPHAALAPVIARGLAAQPAARWPTMDAFVDALAAAGAGRRRGPAILIASLALAAVALVVASIAISGRRGPPPRDPAIVLSEDASALIQAGRFDECAAMVAARATDDVARKLGLHCATQGTLATLTATCASWRAAAPGTVPAECDATILRARALEDAHDYRGCADAILASPPTTAANLVLARCAQRVDDLALTRRQCVYGLTLNGLPVPPDACGR
ncbi:MAG: serine/threonine protein kinase [Deltaproteobacteria bacterium]|nr:serine/threonine protein kinase [Deltaproteobacteria bacterium]